MHRALISALLSAALLAACAAAPELSAEPSYTIHHPELYGSVQPLVDDDGIALALPARQPAAWYEGTGRMVD